MSDVKDIPMGLSFRMAMNEKALNTYAEMTPRRKRTSHRGGQTRTVQGRNAETGGSDGRRRKIFLMSIR